MPDIPMHIRLHTGLAPGQKDPSTEPVKTSVLERSYRELLCDQVGGIDERRIIATLKNIRNLSYRQTNMFDHIQFEKGHACKVVYDVVPNPISGEEFFERVQIKAQYRDRLDGLAFPLNFAYDRNIVQARLVICTPRYQPEVIAVQIRYGFSQNKWSTVYCATNTVEIAIRSLVGNIKR